MDSMRRLPLALLAALAMTALFALPSSAAPVSIGHSGWTWGNPLPQGNTLRAVEFAGGVGYATGDFGTVLRTDDGGTTWGGIATGITPYFRHVRAPSEVYTLSLRASLLQKEPS